MAPSGLVEFGHYCLVKIGMTLVFPLFPCLCNNYIDH